MEKLITAYRFELVEDHHSPGSGRYGVLVTLQEDISAVLPYLNSMLDDTLYDQENRVLIGSSNGCRYAFRPHEIQIGIIPDPSAASRSAAEAVDLVNRIWLERDRVVPSSRERKLPTIYALFRLLPRAQCGKECGYPSCLAFAADLRTGAAPLERCPLLSTSQYADNRKQIIAIFSVD
ncbi:MAG: (Fe-S)-binding protein [Syntrophales bacterium]